MSENTPPSQMIRVPSALVDAVKELSRLHRSGYTSAVLTGLQQLIASIDSTADSVASVTGGKSDTELLAELLAGLDERIATQVAVQVAQLQQRIEQLEQRQSLLSSPSATEGKLPDTTPDSQAKHREPLVVESNPQESIAIAANPLEDIAVVGADHIAGDHTMVEDAAPVGGEDLGIAIARNTLENISAPATTSNESVEEAAPALGQGQNLEPLTSTGLAERLGVNESNISRNKGKGNEHFRRWSRKRDPNGIAWEYRLTAKLKYHPVI